VPPDPVPDDSNPPKPRASWLADAVTIYAEHIGYVPFGRLGKALAPLVQLHGWSTVKTVWLTYCQNRPYLKRDGTIWGDNPRDRPENAPAKDVRWTTPEDFARTYVFWKEQV
jgi:hypothetical protein